MLGTLRSAWRNLHENGAPRVSEYLAMASGRARAETFGVRPAGALVTCNPEGMQPVTNVGCSNDKVPRAKAEAHHRSRAVLSGISTVGQPGERLRRVTWRCRK